MKDIVFIDTNILMYAVGSEHPLKKPCLEIINQIAQGTLVAVTDTEVFQEVAYRYWSQKKWPVALQVLRDYQLLFEEIHPIERGLLPLYYNLLSEYPFLSPRDAIHVAVMKFHHLETIYTADRAIRRVPFIKVLDPLQNVT